MLPGTAEQMEEARKSNVNAVHLAAKPVPYDPDKLPQRVQVEIKSDGIGMLYLGDVIQSLEGVDMDCARHLAGELSGLAAVYGEPMMLHGEYMEKGGFGATLSAFRRGEGEGCAFIWDAITLKAWNGHEQSPPLQMRRELLQTAFDTVRPRMLRIAPAVAWPPAVEVVEQLEIMLNTALEDGHEGLVVKDLDSPYVRGPSPYWMKMKGVETIEGIVQGVRLEDGSDRMKAVILNVEGKPVFVGSGLTEAQRDDPSDFTLGRIVEIRHVGRLPSGAYRGAAFVRFRDDKVKRNGR